MLYITGEKETLMNLCKMENYSGSLEEYSRLFYKNNDHLRANQPLSRFTPILLSSSPCKDQKELAREIHAFSESERNSLRQMQESGHDIVMLIIMQDIMEELQHYGEKFRKHYDLPLISTPWSVVNHSLTNASLIDILSETSIYASYSIKNSRRMFFFDELYENLMQRDDLNRRLWILKRNNAQGNLALQKNLEQQIKKLTSEIKRGLNAKIDQKLTKYLSSFGHDEIRKMKMGSFSMKMARKNQLITTRLDILNRSGVTTLRSLVTKLQVIGNHAGKISTMLGVGAVAYDVVNAHQKGDSTVRAFLTGTAGISTGIVLSASSISLSSLGASLMSSTLVLGGIAGETAAGATTVFLCTPAGPIVLTVAGAAAVGYASYLAAEYVGEYYDKHLAEHWNKYGDTVSQMISDCARSANEMIDKAWKTSLQWILDFYQPSKK